MCLYAHILHNDEFYAGHVDEQNRLEVIDPLCNVVAHRLKDALAYYASPSTPRTNSLEDSRE
jgi:hypothetical protein